jgi:hypothetical protein
MTFNGRYYVENTKPVKGYKAFQFDLSCRPNGNVVKYRVGRGYTLEGPPVLCQRGFHFCPRLYDVFMWYGWVFDIRVCEVEAAGRRVESPDGRKCCTDRIRIVRELSPEEIVNSPGVGVRVFRKGHSKIRDSIHAFLNKRRRYVLWVSETYARRAREKDLPYLEERAGEWTRALNKLNEMEVLT